MTSRRRSLRLTVDLAVGIVLLTVAATYIRRAPTTAAFFGLIGLMSLTVFVAELRRIKGPHPRLGFGMLSVFVVLGAVVLGQTIAGGNEGVWTALGYAAATFLLVGPTWLGLRYLRRRG
jgi:hypothetical protein